uniref:Uncharacterized protein n=1 Tax=Anguilla anguilla TaxID=7936 RepID=A0A0E9TEX8_ANGAN
MLLRHRSSGCMHPGVFCGYIAMAFMWIPHDLP